MIAPFLTLALLAAPTVKPATNTVDPVCHMKVTDKDKTVEVRGQAYRVCSKYCGDSLTKDPDKYLNKDGTVKEKAK